MIIPSTSFVTASILRIILRRSTTINSTWYSTKTATTAMVICKYKRRSPLVNAVSMYTHSTMRMLAIKLIEFYQATLSPDHGPLRHLHPYGFCRHEPTCSDYGKQIIQKRGVIIGCFLICKRILSCNPWKKIDDQKIVKIVDALK